MLDQFWSFFEITSVRAAPSVATTHRPGAPNVKHGQIYVAVLNAPGSNKNKGHFFVNFYLSIAKQSTIV